MVTRGYWGYPYDKTETTIEVPHSHCRYPNIKHPKGTIKKTKNLLVNGFCQLFHGKVHEGQLSFQPFRPGVKRIMLWLYSRGFE
jgi:hypothetical protein